jgi:hypothetical protein
VVAFEVSETRPSLCPDDEFDGDAQVHRLDGHERLHALDTTESIDVTELPEDVIDIIAVAFVLGPGERDSPDRSSMTRVVPLARSGGIIGWLRTLMGLLLATS